MYKPTRPKLLGKSLFPASDHSASCTAALEPRAASRLVLSIRSNCDQTTEQTALGGQPQAGAHARRGRSLPAAQPPPRPPPPKPPARGAAAPARPSSLRHPRAAIFSFRRERGLAQTPRLWAGRTREPPPSLPPARRRMSPRGGQPLRPATRRHSPRVPGL